jgi:chromate transporter
MSPATFVEALRFWHRLGWISFGGPAGQIAIMHAELVERRAWVDEATFLRGLNFCMLLPGPEAMQLATWLGWRLHGLRGGLAAGVLFVLPASMILALLSWIYLRFGSLPPVAAALFGVQCAVLGILVVAIRRLAMRVLKNAAAVVLAVGAFIALAVLQVPFPIVVIAAALIGFVIHRFGPARTASVAAVAEHLVLASPLRAMALGAILLLAWWAPLLAVRATLGADSTAWAQGVFFSQAALVTFGGAYAVLPYVAQQAVETHGWLDATQMLAGLGLAESTPGPLVIVLEFVGFVAGWQHPDLASPLASALLGAAIAVWATFLPSFLFVLPLAPWVERLATHAKLQAALSAITAAVVGVIVNLALWFGWHLLASRTPGVIVLGCMIAAVSAYGLIVRRWRVEFIILGAAFVGFIAAPWL